jgi:hydrogenase nickel incorporation protein HypA/HybF
LHRWIMHELSVTESILDISLRHAQKARAVHISNLYLVIGDLSSVVDDSVQFYWDILSKDTLAEDSKLHFRRVPGELLCLDCDTRYPLRDSTFNCPNCNSARVKVVAGEEFYVEAIDVET